MALYGQPCRFLYGNIVGRLIALNRVLGRNARFYNPEIKGNMTLISLNSNRLPVGRIERFETFYIYLGSVG